MQASCPALRGGEGRALRRPCDPVRILIPSYVGHWEEARLFKLTLGAAGGVDKSSAHGTGATAQACCRASFPGARLALQPGTVCTG